MKPLDQELMDIIKPLAEDKNPSFTYTETRPIEVTNYIKSRVDNLVGQLEAMRAKKLKKGMRLAKPTGSLQNQLATMRKRTAKKKGHKGKA